MEESKTISEEESESIRTHLLDRGIFKLYEFGIKWMPIPIMLGHWYGVYDYAHYPRAVIVDTDINGDCVIWLYILAYVYMPLAMLPASYFFHYCWIFRIPFLYFFGINAIRLYYHNWMIRPNQLDAHFIFILFTIILYAYGLTKKIIENRKNCCRNA